MQNAGESLVFRHKKASVTLAFRLFEVGKAKSGHAGYTVFNTCMTWLWLTG